MNIKEIKEQLDLLTAKLREYESAAERHHVNGSNFIAAGLRLSQEVEILQKQNLALRRENEALRQELAVSKPDWALCSER
ncbi:MAG TPA: hypothetical protein VGL72_11955 [Bryobacteraceae bacterium]|jgi:FtsZ-binding cell division protein ZapB